MNKITEVDPVAWLLEDGDPSIHWQAMRDLLALPEPDWRAEQRQTLSAGWGARLLALQADDGSWGGGLYSPKWTSTTYTLLSLHAIGIPGNHAGAQKGANLVLDRLLGPRRDEQFLKNLAGCDRCIVGMILLIAVRFGIRDERVDALVANLLAERMQDGGWNCRRARRPFPHHSSFNTTLNVLDGLREWLETTPAHPLRNDVLAAEHGALEMLLEHRLYRSHRTGEIINPTFLLLSYPTRWHYTTLRALAYFARVGGARDERLADAIQVLREQRSRDGTWAVHHKFSGKVFFEMEKLGGPSRWNTLHALRVLKWWQQ